MSHTSLYNHVRLDIINNFLNPEHVLRKLDDKPAESTKTIDVFCVPAGPQPSLANQLEFLSACQAEFTSLVAHHASLLVVIKSERHEMLLTWSWSPRREKDVLAT